MRRQARTIVELESKRVGEDKYRKHRIGTDCHVERNGSNFGEFFIWFGGKHYKKVDAIQLHDLIVFTDDRPGF